MQYENKITINERSKRFLKTDIFGKNGKNRCEELRKIKG